MSSRMFSQMWFYFDFRELEQNGKVIVDTNGDTVCVTNLKVRTSLITVFYNFYSHFYQN